MTLLATIIGAMLLLPIAIIDAVFLTELLAGLMPPRKAAVKAAASAPSVSQRIAVIVPAHDEAPALGAHLAALQQATPPAVRVLLVADNCTDATAAVARSAGVDVVERNDPARRGKGYALAFGRDHLAADPPDVVIVLDADCRVGPACIERLTARVADSGRAVQSAYLFRTGPGAPVNVQVSNFAIAVKNLLRQRGARRIGAPALLTGSGMAFPWPVFAELELATGEVVEDLALGVGLVRRGLPPVFEERALTWSEPSSEGGTATQRARWEGGFLAIARTHAGPLIADGVLRLRWTSFWMGLHLLVPPLSLLLAANVAVLVALALLALLGMAAWPLVAALALLALLVGGVIAAWRAVGRDHLPAANLVRLPLYLLWKLALHLRLVSGRERAAWIRTERLDQDR